MKIGPKKGLLKHFHLTFIVDHTSNTSRDGHYILWNHTPEIETPLLFFVQDLLLSGTSSRTKKPGVGPGFSVVMRLTSINDDR
jgi:hypothetical protein